VLMAAETFRSRSPRARGAAGRGLPGCGEGAADGGRDRVDVGHQSRQVEVPPGDQPPRGEHGVLMSGWLIIGLFIDA